MELGAKISLTCPSKEEKILTVVHWFVFLVLEAVLIATPFYGGVTQSVFLYGNVKLVYAYLDSKVRIEGGECTALQVKRIGIS